MPKENTSKIQGYSRCSFSFTNLLSAGKAITKYRTPSSFCLFLTRDYPLKKPQLLQIASCYQLKPQKGRLHLAPQRGRGAFLPTFERVTYSLGGFSSVISFCRVLPLILFIPHIQPLSHQDIVQITAIPSGFWFFFKSLPSTSTGVQLLREAEGTAHLIVATKRRVLKGPGGQLLPLKRYH